MSASSRWLVVIAATTVILVAAGLVAAQVIDREVEYDVSTPEGTVQAYLRAVAEGDATAAYAFYGASLQEHCDVTYLRDSLRWGAENFRASLRDVVTREDTVEVRISLVQTYGSGPFGRSESVFDQVFVLEESPDGWRFTEAPWPSWCPVPATPASPRGALPVQADGRGAELWS